MQKRGVTESKIRRASMKPRLSLDLAHAAAELIAFYRRNGYVRVADEALRRELGQKYKKGYEVRLVAYSDEDLRQMRHLLQQVGLEPGRPYEKHRQTVLPIYGKSAVEWFISRDEMYAR